MSFAVFIDQCQKLFLVRFVCVCVCVCVCVFLRFPDKFQSLKIF